MGEVKGENEICIGFSILKLSPLHVHGRSLFSRICIIYYTVVGPLSFKLSHLYPNGFLIRRIYSKSIFNHQHIEWIR